MIFCEVGTVCDICRAVNTGRKWRENIARHFNVSPEFACPKGLPWIEDEERFKELQTRRSNMCVYMMQKCNCARSMKDGVYKIKCTHPDVPEEFANTRTNEKCSIPFDAKPEEGMQFCKHYTTKNKSASNNTSTAA